MAYITAFEVEIEYIYAPAWGGRVEATYKVTTDAENQLIAVAKTMVEAILPGRVHIKSVTVTDTGRGWWDYE